jgi:hypothetical protein
VDFAGGGFGMSFRKKLLEPLGYQLPENLLFEDAYMSFLSVIRKGAVISKKPFIKYRRAENSLSRINPYLNEKETLEQEKRFLKMFLSLENAKYDYFKNDLEVNETIQRNKDRALNYLKQKILTLEFKLDVIEGIINWVNWSKLLFLIVRKGVELKKSLKLLILYFYRKKFVELMIKEYKERALIL